MGLVKFGQQTLNIENVPDGHILVSEAELKSIRDAANSYYSLNSSIPVEIDRGKVGELAARGSRYDSIVKEREELAAKLNDLEKQLGQYKDIPEGFSKEKWNNYVQTEQKAIRQGKLDKLMADALAKAEKETGVKYSVDPRFVPTDVINNFDVEATDALDNMYKILDGAHTAQQEFIQKQMSVNLPNKPLGGAEPPPADGGVPQKGPHDRVDAAGMKLQGF
jgi:hypothetical protein